MATTAVNPTQNMAPAVAGAPGAVSQPGQAQVPTAPGAANTSVSLSNLSQIMQQPAVRKAMPAIVAFLSVAVFLIAYSWMQDPVYRTVYPGLSESDRQAAFEALSGGDFNARIDSGTGELKVASLSSASIYFYYIYKHYCYIFIYNISMFTLYHYYYFIYLYM